MIVYNKTNWKLPVTVFLAFIVCIIECTINMDSTGIGTTNRTSYLLDYDAIKSVTHTVRDEDTSFYRMDKKFGARSKMTELGIITTQYQHFHQPQVLECQNCSESLALNIQ